jgi:hypothetical protein
VTATASLHLTGNAPPPYEIVAVDRADAYDRTSDDAAGSQSAGVASNPRLLTHRQASPGLLTTMSEGDNVVRGV